jgi:uncharacterized protein YndB with AHSA1/START domain
MEMTATSFEINAPAGEPVITSRRFIKAPPSLVFAAWTTPEHLRRWWGPRRLELSVCEIDLRVGGGYRFVHRAPDGQEFAFHGEYREIDPPHRMVTTFVYEGAPDDVAVETLELEECDGGTLMRSTSVHSSVEARDMHIASGMEGGMTESYEQLDELMALLQAT